MESREKTIIRTSIIGIAANLFLAAVKAVMMEVMKQHRVALTAIGVYSYNTQDEEVSRVEKKVREIAFAHQYVRQIHGFYLTKETKNIRFDLVISLEAADRRAAFQEVVDDVQREFPDYGLSVIMDTDFSGE